MTHTAAVLGVLVFLLGMALGALIMVIFWGYIVPSLRLMQVVRYGSSEFVVVGYQPDRHADNATISLVRRDVYERDVRQGDRGLSQSER